MRENSAHPRSFRRKKSLKRFYKHPCSATAPHQTRCRGKFAPLSLRSFAFSNFSPYLCTEIQKLYRHAI